MKTALLLMAHGSSQQEANNDLHFIAAELLRRGKYPIVEASFLELAQPTIEEGAARCVGQSAEQIVMVPYFLSAGVHVRRDLTDLRSHLSARFPDVKFLLAEPLGPHPLLLEVVLARVEEAKERSG